MLDMPQNSFSVPRFRPSNNPYGASKAKAENTLRTVMLRTRVPAYESIDSRISSGNGADPNYNSVTATFCHNIANDLPIVISDPLARSGIELCR